MRELIYLSVAKLRQFQPDRPAGRWRRMRELDAQAPLNLGGLRLSFPDDPRPEVADLERVLRHLINESDQPPRWYTEDELTPGQWVQFEAQMNYQVLGPQTATGPKILVFWEVAETARIRLLLHGSPCHLLAAAGTQEQTIYPTASVPHMFLEALSRVVDDSTKNRTIPLERVWSLIEATNLLPADMAPCVVGMARVTAIINTEDRTRIVLASPLYVEYSR